MKTHPKKQHHASAKHADNTADTVRYNVVSPDGFPITPEPFASVKAAKKFIPIWVEGYRQQGYYKYKDFHIPFKILHKCVEIEAVLPNDDDDSRQG
jgi:hypothetical protein